MPFAWMLVDGATRRCCAPDGSGCSILPRPAMGTLATLSLTRTSARGLRR